MVTHSSILAWEIPWTGEPGRLQSMESCTKPNLAQSGQKGRGAGYFNALGIVSVSSAGLKQENT